MLTNIFVLFDTLSKIEIFLIDFVITISVFVKSAKILGFFIVENSVKKFSKIFSKIGVHFDCNLLSVPYDYRCKGDEPNLPNINRVGNGGVLKPLIT